MYFLKRCFIIIVLVIIVLPLFTCIPTEPSIPKPSSSIEAQPGQLPIEQGKGRILLYSFRNTPENISVRKIVDEFLIGVGTTDMEGWISPAILKDLRFNGVNYYLPLTTWALIERKEGSYKGEPAPGMKSLDWLSNSKAVLNGHCLLFLIDEEYAVPEFAFNRTFDEQKEMIEAFIKATVNRFPEIQIWTLNEPIAQNCFGWSREQIYDVFVSASKWIHEINPQAKVMLNMIPIKCNWSGIDYEPDKVLSDLLNRGIEVDIIGIELYYWWAPERERDENGYPKISWVKSTADIFKKSKLPVLFSEVGVPGFIDEKDQYEKQADWMESFFRYCHSDTDIIGATWFFIRDDQFMPYAGLVNKDYTYRPVGERLIKLANEWNPQVTYVLKGKNYLDLDTGKYDIVVNSELYQVTVAESQTIELAH